MAQVSLLVTELKRYLKSQGITYAALGSTCEATAKYANMPMEKVFVNLDRYGNMSSASIPVALDEAEEMGLIGPGANVLTVAFGAGLTWGAMVVRW